MIGILDAAREFLGCPKRERPDQYRLVRPRFRFTCDADTWLRVQNLNWPSATAHRQALLAWIDLRQQHRVAWLERGGSEQR